MKTTPLLAVLALLLSAATIPGATLSVGTVRGFPGATVSVPVTVRFGSNGPFSVVAMQADIAFDSHRASLVPERGAALGQRRLLSAEPTNGVERLVWYGADLSPFSNGVVAMLSVAVATNAGLSPLPLTLRNVILATAAPAVASSTNRSGAVAINTIYVRPDGDVDAFIAVTNGETYLIQATTNFVNWETISRQTAESSLMQFIDLDAHQYPHRFYRALPVEFAGELAVATPGVDGALRWSLSGRDGRTYVVETTTNLMNWSSIATNVAAGGRFEFTDPAAQFHRQRFYRAKSQ